MKVTKKKSKKNIKTAHINDVNEENGNNRYDAKKVPYIEIKYIDRFSSFKRPSHIDPTNLQPRRAHGPDRIKITFLKLHQVYGPYILLGYSMNA